MSEFVTASEASEILGCSEALIRKRIRKNELPATKDRGQWQILRVDLDLQPRPHETTAPQDRTAEPHAWRDDLLAQVARLEADKVEAAARLDEVRHEAARRETEAGVREERSKARVIDLERELTVRDSRMTDFQALRESEAADMRGQIAVLEAKVREVLEDGKSEALQLANRIADLVDRQQASEARIYELQPVAEQVPMLQAAVEEKDASLSERERELGNMRQDIDTIASRPVTGPVFRLLTKGRLRR